MELSLVLVICGSIAAGARWTAAVDARLDGIEKALSEGNKDRWTGSDMRAWVNAFDDAAGLLGLQMQGVLGEDAEIPEFYAPDPDAIRGAHR